MCAFHVYFLINLRTGWVSTINGQPTAVGEDNRKLVIKCVAKSEHVYTV